MKRIIFHFLLVVLTISLSVTSCTKEELAPAFAKADFENFALAENSFWNGSDGSGGFKIGNAVFPNQYTDYGGGYYAWNGFAYSNITDNTTGGYANQYSAIAGAGADYSSSYAVSYVSSRSLIQLTESQTLKSIDITNSTYAAFSMKTGDLYAKKFGGTDGNDADYFLLTIKGIDEKGKYTGTIHFYLADYRFQNQADDYIVTDWKSVDLTKLGKVKILEFTLSSTDNGMFGMNTPAYFCLDNLVF